MSRQSDGSCSICGKPQDPQLRPFCSKRCKNLDLARWLTGSYSIPEAADEPDIPEEDPELH